MNTINQDTLQSIGLSSNRDAVTSANEDRNKLGQEQFLELMVAQIRNQDPFDPLDNGEFLSQIAQFSTVTGIQDLQDSFASFASSLSSNQALQASALVGRSVLVNTEEVSLTTGEKIEGALSLSGSSSEVNVEFYNAAGELIRSLPLGPQSQGTVQFTWDGLNDSGTAAPAGVYRIVANETINGETFGVETSVKDTVESVLLGRFGEGTILNLSLLGPTNFNQINEIR